MIGQTISHYTILEKLGEGGMGIVYKAHDTKLDRDVALKFFPHHVSATADDQSRFLQEAQAAAALNHPNICTIHDICLDPDQQFIVMEWIDGRTLRQMIPVGKMQTAIDYAVHIGDALQEAHSKGVVHRDIKTDNIMINAKNQIKVMDFGLAKLMGASRLTKTSTTVGTLAYMAPEQIQSGDVDARSDIFSFGVVLYEMLTSHLPFRGEHEAAMMYSIVNEEPKPIQKYLPEASSELIHVLNRALEKEPDERYQSVTEMVIDLRRLKKDTGRFFRTAPVAHHPEGMGEASENIHRRSRKRFAIILLAAVFIACVAAAIVFLSPGTQLNPDMKILDLQIPFQDVMYGSLSASGKSIVFPAADDQGKFDIYMMNVSTRQPIRITNDSSRSIHGVSISPDEGIIAYKRTSFAGVSELVVTPIGGISKVIKKNNVVGVCGFCDGGKRILYLTAMKCSPFQAIDTLWSYALDGSDQKSLVADTAFLGSRWSYDLSANGRYVAWTKTFAEGFSEIMVRDLEKGTVRRLTFDKKFVDDVRWTPFGKIVYASDRGGSVNLWMISEQGGEPQQITRGTGPHFPASITKDGKRLLYSELKSVGTVKSMDLASGTVRQLSPRDRLRSAPAVSNSGRFIAFAAQDQDATSLSYNIYIADRDGKNIRKITDDVNEKFSLSWSPDDAQIKYSAASINDLKDSVHVYIVDPSRPGGQRQLMAGSAWWWNAKQLMVRQDMHSYLYSIDSDHYEKTPEDSVFAFPVLNNKYVVLYDHRKARKGLWIATMSSYQSNGAAKATSLVKPLPLLSARSVEGGDIYYLTAIGGAMYRLKLPGGKSERVKNVPPGFGVGYRGRYGFTVCGNELVYTEYQTHTRYFIIDNLIK